MTITLERFEAKVDRRGDDECWPWLASHQKNGYGRFQGTRAHRFAHEAYIGPIPPGYDVDHVYAWGCRFRDCTNPRHLEAVPHQVNIQRGSVGRRTHCTNGHSLADALIHHGRRECRECNRLACQRQRQRKREAA